MHQIRKQQVDDGHLDEDFLIYFGGPVITVNDAQPGVKAIAVKDGKIVAVGAKVDVEKAHRGEKTSTVSVGDVERAAISCSFHPDMPMAPGQPLALMWRGVNPTTTGGRVTAPEQRISRLGALKAVTLDAACLLQLEEEMGSVVPGRLANFITLGDNPVTCNPMRIKDIPIWGTVQEGRVLLLIAGTVWAPLASADTFTVTATADSLAGSLRQAIVDANAHAGPDTIALDIRASDPGHTAVRAMLLVK